MKFADKYLQKNNRKAQIQIDPDPDCDLLVIIPCYNEPDILQTLGSLNDCAPASSKTEVIVIINHSGTSSEEIKLQNAKTRQEIDDWIGNHQKDGITFYAIGPVEFPKKWAGAGLARKLGMDEAICRFNLLDNPDGVIISLDADTLVEKNYLDEIENYFNENPKHVGATISFQHQTEGLTPKHLEGIQLYEKYMNYYKSALEFAGYPFPMFTVGSAFAVLADAYVKRGGMNRRQAGEDFYFLQNLVQLGPVGEIKTTQVFPSARLSDRVPFGTGPILSKWMSGEEDLTQTYNFQAFIDLKALFSMKDKFYQINEDAFLIMIGQLPIPLEKFILDDNFLQEIKDLNQNCSSLKSFQTRFFQKFNAFKILKYLNFSHADFYKKESLDVQFSLLKMNV